MRAYIFLGNFSILPINAFQLYDILIRMFVTLLRSKIAGYTVSHDAPVLRFRAQIGVHNFLILYGHRQEQ